MNKATIKDRIYAYEMGRNGFWKLSGCDVAVHNIKISKDKVVADVTLHEDLDGVSTRYKGCEYPMSLFKEVRDGKETHSSQEATSD